MSQPVRVLFICSQNSARSQMAQAYLREKGGDRYDVHSAGLEPTTVNPLAIKVMQEDGIDISHHTTSSAFERFRAGELFDFVVTVCDAETEAKCPVFPGVQHRLHWPFPDPAATTGSDDEKLATFRTVRDQIKTKIDEFLPWCAQVCPRD